MLSLIKYIYQNRRSVPAVKPRLKHALYSPVFERFITILIVINAIILAALTYDFHAHGLPEYWATILVAVDLGILLIFSLEIGLKIIVDGFRFFKKGWNIFDFFIVGLGVFGTGYPLSVLRSLRILRTFRLVTRVPSMKVVVESFLRALPGIGSVLTVMLLVLFVYSVMGTQMFGPVAPELFGTLQLSAFTMFTVLTLEGWPDVSRQVMDSMPYSWIYFVTYIAINSFAVFNLMIAVIITAMHKEYDEHAEEEREDIIAELKELRREIHKLSAQQRS